MTKKQNEGKLHPFLHLSGIKNEQDFYKKYPTQEDFYKDYPQARNGYTLDNDGIPTLEESGALGEGAGQVQPIAASDGSVSTGVGGGANYASVIGKIATTAGDIIDTIGSVNRTAQIVAPQLLNALIPENHNTRVRTPQVGDNPYAYGTGSQMMYENGGNVKTNNTSENPIFDLSVENNSIKPISQSFARIGGNTHTNGGTEIEVLSTGERIEAQKGEPISKQINGELVAWGKMKNPHTGNIFERDANILAEMEKRTNKLSIKGEKLMNGSQMDSLDYSTGNVILDAAKAKDIDTSIKKEIYAKTQQDILDIAQSLNTDPKKLSNKIAKNGAILKNKAAVGDTISNPPATYSDEQVRQFQQQGNWGQNVFNQAVQNTKWFDPNIPSDVSGYQQYWVKNYPELVQNSFNTNTFANPFPNTNKGYQQYPVTGAQLTPDQSLYAFQDGLAGNRNIQVNQRGFTSQEELDAWTKDRKAIRSQGKTFYPTDQAGVYDVASINQRPQIQSLYQASPNNGLIPITSNQPTVKPIPTQSATAARAQQEPLERTSLADRNKFQISSILPEINALLDRPNYVQGQEYRPMYAQPYQVSYQDRVNQGTAEFNRLQNTVQNDPLALATLAGQQRRANDTILAEEFRTNQMIENAVATQNQQLFNQATLQNLQLADQQYMRQEQARANTEAAQQRALQSISAKEQQRRAENNAIRLVENMSDFRVNNQMQAYNEGGPAQIVDAQGNVWMGTQQEYEEYLRKNKFVKNKN